MVLAPFLGQHGPVQQGRAVVGIFGQQGVKIGQSLVQAAQFSKKKNTPIQPGFPQVRV
jgi:hypothetical protein